MLSNFAVFYMKAIYLFYSFKFVYVDALRPNSTAIVMVGRSNHLTTLFLGKLEQVDN